MSTHLNSIVLITGGSSGMGKATAMYVASKGAKAITLFARGEASLNDAAEEIRSKYPATKVIVVVGDAAKVEDMERAVQETVAAFGGLTGAFINAGAYRGGSPLAETEVSDIDTLLDVNVKGVIYAFKSIIPAIKMTVGDSGPAGSIVVNSSVMGQAILAPKSIGSSIYSASKAFVNSLTESAAIENAPRIRVNAVLPGVVQTNIMPVNDDTYQAIGAAMQPLYGRAGKAVEVASLVSYLLSEEASFVSGSLVKVDGLWGLSDGSFPS